MLNDSYYQFLKDNVQIIVTDKEGLIKESSNTFFRVSEKQAITDLHPFFYILADLEYNSKKEHYFHCVQMTVLAKKKYFDISVKLDPKSEVLLIYLQDLSEHYKNVRAIQQTKNESTIQFQTIEKLNGQLEEQRTFKDKFLANVNHEILSLIHI